MPPVWNEYRILEVKCKRKWFWDLFFITSVYSWKYLDSSHRKFWRLAKSDLAGRTGVFVSWIKILFFESFYPNPIITLHTTQWQIGLTEQSRLIVNIRAFYVVVSVVSLIGQNLCHFLPYFNYNSAVVYGIILQGKLQSFSIRNDRNTRFPSVLEL